MAQLDTSREALLVIISRVEREHGQTVVANFALDEQLNRAEAHIVQLNAALAAAQEDARLVREKLQQAYDDNETLRVQLDPARGDRFRKKVKVADGADQT